MHPILQEAHAILNKRRVNRHSNIFNHTVEVLHEDGSHFIYHNATLKIRIIKKQRILLVWTEHCDYHAFFCDDLSLWRTYE